MGTLTHSPEVCDIVADVVDARLGEQLLCQGVLLPNGLALKSGNSRDHDDGAVGQPLLHPSKLSHGRDTLEVRGSDTNQVLLTGALVKRGPLAARNLCQLLFDILNESRADFVRAEYGANVAPPTRVELLGHLLKVLFGDDFLVRGIGVAGPRAIMSSLQREVA